MDIWDLAKEKVKANEEKAASLEEKLDDELSGHLATEIKRRHESHVVLCGNSKSVKDIAHLWELGGGTNLTSLLTIPLKAANIEYVELAKNMCMCLSKAIIESARKTVDLTMKDDEALKQRTAKGMKTRMEKYGDDAKLCAPFPIPITIIGGKYDEFQNFDSDKRRIVCQTLRFAAHYYGANLMFFSSRMEQFHRLGKNVLSMHAFGTVAPQGHIVDHSKPLFVKCGDDSFEAIGAPAAASSAASFSRSSAPIQLWKGSFLEAFPQKTLPNEHGEDLSLDPLFREPLIDRLVEQKQKDLELFVRHKREKPQTTENST
ncbi:hypothetical protein WR25_14097 [Diploscapter pachys]|uniref:Cytoplasmic dynein 2 light intermediate chain 1 n=1 Tax=Diploscapter pachys TaxID=2018661 RepID=A0A2A2K827_9BILA|nr:hypothetical protein WR25_14097 [Diploscapter pachys]